MEPDSDKVQLAQARYLFKERLFEGNNSFKRQFESAIELERLRLIIESKIDFGIKTEYFVDVFEVQDQEYLTVICPIEGEQAVMLYSIDTSSMKDTMEKLSNTRHIQQEFLDILESMHDDFVIINNQGIIEKVLPNFEEMYGITAQEAVGKSVHEMEERKIFNPSIALRVMKSLQRETLLQLTGAGKYLMCTAIPVFDKSGNLQKIISYTRDVTKYESLKEEYKNLQETLAQYSNELGQLRRERSRSLKIIGNSHAINSIMKTIDKISNFNVNVLLTGESGVGKTLYAETIHSLSERKDLPFITINCGAIPENLLESELFGYEKGAFTGASNDGKPGMIELAHNGVLFLDEIGDLPLHMQVKLLKVIQDKKVMRVGGVKEKNVDFRLIAATNKNLVKLIEEGKFREDLYYRLNVITIHIPPLRERREDIFCLVAHFLNKYNEAFKVKHTFSNKAIDCLEAYSWPGNTREIENVVERMVITADDFIISEDMLPQYIYSKEANEKYDIGSRSLKEILEEVERKVLLQCYDEYKTTTKVAEVLKISQPSVSLKLNKYNKNKNQ